MIEIPSHITEFIKIIKERSDIILPDDEIKQRHYEFISFDRELKMFELADVSRGYLHSYYFNFDEFFSVVEKLSLEGEAVFKLPTYFFAFSYEQNSNRTNEKYKLLVCNGVLSGKLLYKKHVLSLTNHHFSLLDILFENEDCPPLAHTEIVREIISKSLGVKK